MRFNKKNLSIFLGVLIFTLLGTTLTFAQVSSKEPKSATAQEKQLANQQPGGIDWINNLVNNVQSKYQNLKIKEARKDAASLLAAFTSFCQDLKINCTAETGLVKIGIRGATKEALVQIILDSWTAIKKKATGQLVKTQSKNKTVKQTLKLIDYAGTQVPENLFTLYQGTDFQQTVKDTAENLGKMVVAGNITETQVEGALRDVFSTATTDTAAFAASLMDKYNLKNVAAIILKDPKNTKAIKEAVGQEIQNYADQEMNKLANQALGTIFPVFQGVQIDFTNLNSKTLKSTLRSTIVNAMAQSYLGPQYVALYMAVSTACPPCMEKTHAELRRFDKKYLQPGTEKIGDEWDRFEDQVKAESERVGKQISAEWKRLRDRVSAELDRQKKQVDAEVNRTKEHFQAELKRAQDSRIGKEIERQLNDISNEANRTIDAAKTELKRELDDILKEADLLGKRVKTELNRQATDAKAELKRLGANVKNEFKREVKNVSDEAQKIKEKVEAELKRAADKVKAEAARVKEKVQAEANRLKEKLKKVKKKLKF